MAWFRIWTASDASIRRVIPCNCVCNWPDPAWMDFAHASSQQRHERAAAFAAMFEERLSALEAWYGFQLDSSSQQVGEPIDLRFEVIGVGNIPGVDGNIV